MKKPPAGMDDLFPAPATPPRLSLGTDGLRPDRLMKPRAETIRSSREHEKHVNDTIYFIRQRPRRKSRTKEEIEPERQAVHVGDTLFRCAGRARDQPRALPGTTWVEVPTGCELALTDEVAYGRYINGRRHDHRRRWCRCNRPPPWRTMRCSTCSTVSPPNPTLGIATPSSS